jgi:hypothetical protein
MKKGVVIAVLVTLVLAAIIFFVFVVKPDNSVLSSPPLAVDLPQDCSDSQITALWNSVFKQDGYTTFFTTGTIRSGYCGGYLAYKVLSNSSYNIELLILSGVTTPQNSSIISAYHGNFTKDYADSITGVFDYDALRTGGIITSSTGRLTVSSFDTRSRITSDVAAANAIFISLFEEVPENWADQAVSDWDFFGFVYMFNKSSSDPTRISSGRVASSYNYDSLLMNYSLPSSCTPSCTGKSCGDNGCGGSCGTCSSGQTCVSGSCVTGCTPSCTGKSCGDNGCGGSCGTCTSGQTCVAGVCTCSASWAARNTTCNATTSTLTTYYINSTDCTIGRPANETHPCIMTCAVWTEVTTSCNATDYYRTYYNNTNSSCTTPGSPPEESSTLDCDYRRLGIIGTESDIEDYNLEASLVIDDSALSLTRNYTKDEELTVEIVDEDDNLLVEFDHDFSDSPLSLRDISIKKQSSSAAYGYLIVNGIEDDKTFIVDKLISDSSKVCVEDKEMQSISSISNGCSSSGERVVNCPGENGDFTCSIVDEGFSVSGLSHSGVKEFYTSLPDVCTSDWDCAEWGACYAGTQTRTCVDINNCITTTQTETQSCSSPPSSQQPPGGDLPGSQCSPTWTCTSWTPSTCPESKIKTRTCTDTNNCGTASGKPSESQSCIYKSSNMTTILIIVAVGVVVLLLIILLVFLLRKGRKKDDVRPEVIMGGMPGTRPRGPPPGYPPLGMPQPVSQRPVQPQMMRRPAV